MPTILKRTKPMAVSPLKASQTIGAALAFMGIDRAMPLMHGAQGCTAFGKVFFTRHFREPIPLQTTAMDQVSSVMGADENIVEGLKAVCSKQKPALIGLPTTGLAETQGADIRGAVRQFRDRYPEFDSTRIIPVNTPDYSGSFETGFAAAVYELINVLVPQAEPTRVSKISTRRRRGTINVLAGSLLTIGDIETLKETIEAFGLQAVVVPDLSDSLDGHLSEEEFNPLTYGGTSVAALENLGDADATFVIGRSLDKAADLVYARTGVPDFRFDHLLGLEQNDALVFALHRISGQSVPRRLERQRAQLQDAMVDTHFMLGQTRVAIATDPDLLLSFGQFFHQMGAELVVAVAPAGGPALEAVPAAEVQLGDLEDLERAARARRAELVVGNSHTAEAAERLGLPVLRIGFPLYDQVGGYQRTFVGYRGARQLLFDLANQLMAERHETIRPYRSIYSLKRDDEISETACHDTPATASVCHL